MTGFAGFRASLRPDPGQGHTLEQVLQAAQAQRGGWYDKDPDPVDPEERADELMLRGVMPGETFRLSQQLADVEAEIEAEDAKIDRYRKREQHVMRMHERGAITALQIPQALGDDEGDTARVAMLERRRDRLQAQQAEQMEAMSPPQAQRSQDPVAAAVSRAHAAFVETTRARFADAQAGRMTVRSTPERRPFAGDGAGDDDALARVTSRSAGGCRHCAEMGVTAREAAYIHDDREYAIPADPGFSYR